MAGHGWLWQPNNRYDVFSVFPRLSKLFPVIQHYIASAFCSQITMSSFVNLCRLASRLASRITFRLASRLTFRLASRINFPLASCFAFRSASCLALRLVPSLASRLSSRFGFLRDFMALLETL